MDQADQGKADNSNVFVKYLPEYVDNTGLRSLFSPFGAIISTKVMVNIQTGLSLGFGYVSYLNNRIKHD